jgi:chromosome segregation ATPase
VVRDLLMLPGIPRRLLDDIGELKELVRDLLVTEEELTRTSASMNRKVSALDTANDRLEQALEELRGFNSKLDRLDTRVERLELEMRQVRLATDEIKDVVPDLGRGPLAKAKEALTGE